MSSGVTEYLCLLEIATSGKSLENTFQESFINMKLPGYCKSQKELSQGTPKKFRDKCPLGMLHGNTGNFHSKTWDEQSLVVKLFVRAGIIFRY